MSEGIVNNLVSAWGMEQEGPDPTKVPGLVQIAEEWLEDESHDPKEIAHYFEALRNRIVGAHTERTQALEVHARGLSPELLAIVRQNIVDLEAVEEGLSAYLEAADTGSLEDCWSALGALEEAGEALKVTSELLARMTQGDQPRCTRCGSSGPEKICGQCGAERLLLNLPTPPEDLRETVVMREVAEVFQGYLAVMNGTGTLADLELALQDLEMSFLEARELAQQSMAVEGLEETLQHQNRILHGHLEQVLNGIDLMFAVNESRSAGQLTQGWNLIFEHSVSSSELVSQLAQLDMGEESSS